MDQLDSVDNGGNAEQVTMELLCRGICVCFPEGKMHHTSYPFGIHGEWSVPWDYHSIDKSCWKQFREGKSTCKNCRKLTLSSLYLGIIEQINHGIHKNTPLVYHGVEGLVMIIRWKREQNDILCMSKLNDSQKLLVKVGALDDHKQWIPAIASGWVNRVAPLVQAGLKHQVRIKVLIQQYEWAVDKLYQLKEYSQVDIMNSIILLHLGGACVAEFAHQSLSLPSLMTIWCNTVIQALIVLPSISTIIKIEANIIPCHADLDIPNNVEVVHQVLMLDELAVEKCVWWDN